ncbi:MAG: TlyA family RNA methyltransferase [Chloroflexi bacterium]|nr:TlyA family RNA methyltransferase [Chloroflexota bacterium]
MKSKHKTRLDLLLVSRGLAPTRSKAAAMIMAGEVIVNATVVDKPGTFVAAGADIALKEKPRYVSRGGPKLEAALNGFGIDPTGKVCADIGASTGGFTDCLLQHGAVKVYAIDVGKGIMDYRLRSDNRVVLMENTNARYLDTLGECVELAVVDVSFISLRLILPAVARVISATADVITLVKPQFEAGRSEVGKGGVIRDLAVHRRVLKETVSGAQALEFAARNVMRSPITGAKGNIEYLLWLRRGAASGMARKVDCTVNALTSANE